MSAKSNVESPINQEKNIDQVLFDLHPTARNLFEVILSGNIKYSKYFPSAETLATLINRCERTAQRLCKKLKQFGLIFIISQGRTKTNIYKVTHVFKSFLKRYKIIDKQAASRSRMQDVTLLYDICLDIKQRDTNVEKQPTKIESQPTKKIATLAEVNLNEWQTHFINNADPTKQELLRRAVEHQERKRKEALAYKLSLSNV